MNWALSTAPEAEEIDSARLRSIADHDLAKRAGPGVLTYPALWVLIVWMTQLAAERPAAVYFSGALLLALGVVRPFLVWRIDWVYARRPDLWRGLFAVASLGTAAAWGGFFAAAVYGRPFDLGALLAIVATAGISAGALVTLAPVRTLALAHMSLLLVPAALVLLLSEVHGGPALGVLFVVYYAFVLSSARIVHLEYRRALESQAKLAWLATRDALTGSLNRRAFDERLPAEMERARRYGTALSLVMLDIDRFKEVNDRLGHKAGDAVLVALTALANADLREPDALVRWGGEEFMVIAPHTDLQGARELAERLRLRVAQADFAEAGRITCSFGAAQLREGDSADSLVVRADDALYRAKAGGRDRVELEA